MSFANANNNYKKKQEQKSHKYTNVVPWHSSKNMTVMEVGG